MAVLQGVIEIATGDLIRAGHIDFAALPDFNGISEAVRTDLPEPYYVRGFFNGIFDTMDPDYDKYHRWTGSSWATVANTLTAVSREAFLEVETIKYKTLTYSAGDLNTILYYRDAAKTILLYTKTFNYTGDDLTSITLLRAADSETFTETFTYSAGDLVGIDYS